MSIFETDVVDEPERETDEIERLERYKTIVNAGQATLRALMTLSGGATLAFLAFIGHLLEKGTPQTANVHVLLGALPYLIFATFYAVLGYGLIFLSNCASYIRWHRTSNVMFGATILSGVASIGCFLVASVRAVNAFEILTQSRTAMLYF
jgi:hypothetical protein